MRSFLLLVLLAGAAALGAPAAHAADPVTTLISRSTDGVAGDFDSGGSGLSTSERAEVSVSASGRYVAFQSEAGTLATGDTNKRSDVFVRDRDTDGDGVFDEPGTVSTVLASVGNDGRQEAGQVSKSASLSRDGRYLAFMSFGSLEDADTNGAGDIYVRDLVKNTTTRVSVSTDGKQGDNASMSPAMSPDGRYVAFSSIATSLSPADGDNLEDIYLRDRDTDADGVMDEPGAVKTTLISVGSDQKKELTTNEFPALTPDGRFVAFQSQADEWVPGDANRAQDIYIRDTVLGETHGLSVAPGGADTNQESQEASISDSGRYVAFSSQASNLVAGDTNDLRDVFVVDRDPDTDGLFDEGTTNVIRRMSVSSAEGQSGARSSGPQISPDGKIIVFEGEGNGLDDLDEHAHPDIYIRHRDADLDGILDEPGESATSIVNLDMAGGPADASSWSPVISADTRWIAFSSFASDYVSGDTNNKFDVFVRGPIGDPVKVQDGPGPSPTADPTVTPTDPFAGGSPTLGLNPSVKATRLRKGVSITFAAPVAGTITVSATVTARTARKIGLKAKATKPVVVATGSAAVGAGPGRLKLAPTKAGRKLAGLGRKAKLTLAGAFTAGGGSRSMTGSLQLTKP